MSVRAIIEAQKGDIKSVSPTDTLHDAISLMGRSKIGAVVVLGADGALTGILTERDVVRLISENGASALDQSVESGMTPNPVTCSAADDAYDAIEKMNAQKCRHLPVMEGSSVVGMVSSRDVMESVWHRTAEQDRRQILAQIALA